MAIRSRILPATAPRRGLGLPARLHGAFSIWRHHRQLGELSEELRWDMGLTEADIARETSKPLWDRPAWWR